MDTLKAKLASCELQHASHDLMTMVNNETSATLRSKTHSLINFFRTSNHQPHLLTWKKPVMDTTNGLRTLTGVGLPQNPSHTQTWRDASSTFRNHTEFKDIFATTSPQKPPWVPENKVQYQSPEKYTARVVNMTLVHTGGMTDMAHTVHHTQAVVSLTGTMYKGLNNDEAFSEEIQVALEVVDMMPAVVEACEQYHQHSKDGWITSAGYVTCSAKAGLRLSRPQYLALERAVPKDTMGRVNFYHIAHAVNRLAGRE